MFLSEIPTVLQDLICDFAWKKKAAEVRDVLKIVLMLKMHKLPANFYHSAVWSWQDRSFVPLPLIEFCPLEDIRQYFNFPRIRCILMQLDFRKKRVKSMGNRVFWLNLFENHWFCRAIRAFLKILQRFPDSPTVRFPQRRKNAADRVFGQVLSLRIVVNGF